MKNKKFKLRLGEGQLLMSVASRLGFTKEFAKEMSLNLAEQSMAQQDVVSLYRELKGFSPHMIKERDVIVFGPGDNWNQETKADGNRTYTMVDETVEVKVNLSTEAVSGLYWTLISMLHPSQNLGISPKSQSDMVWPLVESTGLKGQISKDLGIEKAKRRALEFDDEEEEQESEKEVLCD